MAKKDKSAKKKTPKKGASFGDWDISIASHPRATRAVARMKAWAGLLGFAAAAILSWRSGVEPFEVGLRALATGLIFYLAAWAAGIALWRQIILAQLKAEAKRRREERDAALRRLQEAEADDAETRVTA